MQLGSRVCIFGPKQLRLDKAGLGAYIRRCGGELSDADVEKLLFATEGWFSAVYLSLQTLEDRGTLPDKSSDIYDLFTADSLFQFLHLHMVPVAIITEVGIRIFAGHIAYGEIHTSHKFVYMVKA